MLLRPLELDHRPCQYQHDLDSLTVIAGPPIAACESILKTLTRTYNTILRFIP